MSTVAETQVKESSAINGAVLEPVLVAAVPTPGSVSDGADDGELELELTQMEADADRLLNWINQQHYSLIA